jgi:lipoprotein-anchoring transpeptidase ErfK/SrfK
MAQEQGAQGDLVVFAGPSRASGRRGVTARGARVPLFGVKSGGQGGGCNASWWLVGPLAWVCSDKASLSAEEPTTVLPGTSPVSTYFFVDRRGASAYASLASAENGESDRELEGGWAVAVVDERPTRDGERFARTSKGLWIASRDLYAARPSSFQGVLVKDGVLDFAWIVVDRSRVWSAASKAPQKGKAIGTRERFEVVHVLGEEGARVQTGPNEWINASDVARPRPSSPPAEVSRPDEHWIDVDLATQTLVAYAGTRPVYATLVSTGRGPPGSESATPPGVHRIWVKLRASDMDNVARDDLEAHYSLEDVPYVQFFDHAVGLHGAYWHRDFGHVKSHGCVNLAPLDARWLFDFTEPRMPAGWVAAYPTEFDPGTAVRVR